ncbi:hypothetical protein U1Q18_036041 [Sarracenia purpurea var. burkii]
MEKPISFLQSARDLCPQRIEFLFNTTIVKDSAVAGEGFGDCVEITCVAHRRLRFDEIREKKAVTDSVGDENREVAGGSGSLIGVSAGGGRVLAAEALFLVCTEKTKHRKTKSAQAQLSSEKPEDFAKLPSLFDPGNCSENWK